MNAKKEDDRDYRNHKSSIGAVVVSLHYQPPSKNSSGIMWLIVEGDYCRPNRHPYLLTLLWLGAAKIQSIDDTVSANFPCFLKLGHQ